MGISYGTNQFNEVIEYLDGRKNNDTRLNRELTGYEEQLLEEIEELKTELNRGGEE